MAPEARRAQVIAVAADLFARSGYHHVSMDEIADRAGVGKPVLYRHFRSKLGLYLDVIDARGQALVAAIDASLTGPSDATADGRQVVRGVVKAYVQFVEDSGESFSLLFESDVTRDSDVRERVERASAAAAQAVCRGLRELAGLPPAHAALLSAGLVGLARVAATGRYRSQEVSVEETVELVTRLAWAGVAGFVNGRAEQPA